MTSSPKPSRKLLAIAGALSVVAGSFAAVPATFAANVSASVPGGNSQNSTEECRHIAVSATQYQGLPGQYQVAYSQAHHKIFLLLRTPADSDRWRRHLERCIHPEPCHCLPVPDHRLHRTWCYRTDR